MVEKIGLPRSDFFMDFFDMEYCLRARSYGYKIAVINEAELAHEVGNGRHVRILGYSTLWTNQPPWREYYISRNMIYAVWWLYANNATKCAVARYLATHAAGVALFSTSKIACLWRMAQGAYDGYHARLGIRFRPDSTPSLPTISTTTLPDAQDRAERA
jgi:rhamnosyltransferase